MICAFASLCTLAAEPTLDVQAARHLLVRTGFGPTGAEVAAFTGLTRAAAVDRVLGTTRTEALTPPPSWTTEPASLRPPGAPMVSEEDRKAFRQLQQRRTAELRAWWVREMLNTTSPLTERMTLFWHNHFVSSQQKVRIAQLMYRQNATFRRYALGNFRDLLHAAAKEPAMVIYLDAAQNRKAAPNENFAREVMELFTLGEGHYSEQDIKQAARAFTGWSIDRETGDFMFRAGVHDLGQKSVFGRSGDFDGDDVLDLLLARPETSEFIVAKLWREFVSPTPQTQDVQRIARAFRESGYDIKVAMRELLLCDAFWAPENRGALVKSPAELVVGTLRSLDLSPVDTLPFAQAIAGMGQVLFAPPNVKGWPGGEAWINTDTLLARKQYLARIGALRPPSVPGDSIAAMSDVQRRAAAVESAVLRARRQMPTSTTAMPISASRNGIDDDMPPLAARMAREADARDRLEAALARGARPLRFDASAWTQKLAGTSMVDKLANGEMLLLPLPAITADVGEARAQRDPALVVRAALLDPVYELK